MDSTSARCPERERPPSSIMSRSLLPWTNRIESGTPELRNEVGTEYYRAAVYTPGTVLVQPTALIRGLADSLPENVSLYERSPVVSIEYGRRIRLQTPAGCVDGAQVLLAVGGYAPRFGCYRSRMFSLGLFASMTRPLSTDERPGTRW